MKVVGVRMVDVVAALRRRGFERDMISFSPFPVVRIKIGGVVAEKTVVQSVVNFI